MTVFDKNLKAFYEVDEICSKDVEALQNSNFNKRFAKMLDGNFIDNVAKTPLYQNPNLEVKEKIKYFDENFPKHPVLFIFGLGNARLIHHLLKNIKHKRIIVFEPELELFYYAFESFDFSLDLKSERLILFYVPRVSLAQLGTLFTYEDIEQSVKTYNFTASCHFYEKYYRQDLERLHQNLLENAKFAFMRKGNDVEDALIGIQHTLKNLPKMLKRASLKELLTKRNKKAKSAIVVSTGPSLTKQLPLLKQYQDKFIIFCADSAYHILHKHSIKPDYVLSLERIDWTSKLFDNDFGEFDEGILFVVVSFTHENTIKHLEKNHRNYMIVMRPSPFCKHLKIDDYGYLGYHHSVANMAYELAANLGHENIILIGQDLAYAKDGLSHSEDYSLLYSHEGEYEDDKGRFLITAYGGNGTVESSAFWILFKQGLETDIVRGRIKFNAKAYNCTEGGARIEETIEMPFQTACQTLLNKELDKKSLKELSPLNQKEYKQSLKTIKNKFEKQIKKSTIYFEEVKKEIEKLAKLLPRDYEFEKLDFKALKKSKEKFAQFYAHFKKSIIFTEVVGAIYYQNSCELIRLECIVCKDEKEEKEVLITYLSTIAAFFVQAGEYIYTQDEAIKKELEKWDV